MPWREVPVRAWFAALALGALGLVAAGMELQNLLRLAPCPLCIFQRLLYMVIGAIGLNDLMVVDTPDALLVAHRSQVQDVKILVNQLKARGNEAATQHVTASRPWGTYTVLEGGPRFKIKRIEVKPGGQLSLQLHHQRSEHWVVIRGTARVTSGERVFDLEPIGAVRGCLRSESNQASPSRGSRTTTGVSTDRWLA